MAMTGCGVVEPDNRNGRHERSREKKGEIARRGRDGDLAERRVGNAAGGDEERMRELDRGRHEQNDGEGKQRRPDDGRDDLALDGQESCAVETGGVKQVAGRTVDDEREENDGHSGRDPIAEPKQVEQARGVEGEEVHRLRDEPDLAARKDEEDDGGGATVSPLRAGDRPGEKEAEDEKDDEINRGEKT